MMIIRPIDLKPLILGIRGTTGDDFVTGTSGNDLMFGLAGNDTIYGDTGGSLASTAVGGADNISGGDGADWLYGDAGTSIDGNARGGNDILSGGAGGDHIYGDASHLTGNAVGGADTLWADSSDFTGYDDKDVMYGDSYDMTGTSRGGNDTIYDSFRNARTDSYGDALYLGSAGGTSHASGGNDYLQGSALLSYLYGDAYAMNGASTNDGLPTMRGGNDTFDFSSPNGAAYGDANLVQGFVQCGDDVMTAHDIVVEHGVYGANLVGDASQAAGLGVIGGNDTLTGDIGNDTLVGDFNQNQNHVVCGNDTITGGGGNDKLWGDVVTNQGNAVWGADTFVFAPNSGQDTVYDFNNHGLGHAEGDRLDFSAYHLTGISSTPMAGEAFLTSDASGNALIELLDSSGNPSLTNTVTLVGVHVQDLSAADFIL